MELPERCPLCGAMPVDDVTIPKELYRLYGDCYCKEAENMTTPEKDVATYTQCRVKCGECGLHFIICTDYPEQHAVTTMYCPEYGQHTGRFIVWQGVVEGFISQTVPGDAPLVNINGNPIPILTQEDKDKLEEMRNEIEEEKREAGNDDGNSD